MPRGNIRPQPGGDGVNAPVAAHRSALLVAVDDEAGVGNLLNVN